MAFASDSTTAPARPLLPFAFRPAPPVDAPRSADDLLEEIRRTIDEQAAPQSLLPMADLAQARHLRRQLVQAAEHGAALLASLGLPRLVTPDFVPVDTAVAGAAIDDAIAALDALDGDTDLEDGGDAEPSLGWIDGRPQFCGDYQDRELDTVDAEPTALERHGRGFVRSGPDDAEDDDPAERDDEHGSEDAEDIGHHDSQYAPRPLTPRARAEVAVMAARAAQAREAVHA